ncbi:hypothetical protein KAR91_28680 [Candidatus Pacearchaeota archaeon]|nr:hypothetical protein [Candidatus Pacearchaeota archaeon]
MTWRVDYNKGSPLQGQNQHSNKVSTGLPYNGSTLTLIMPQGLINGFSSVTVNSLGSMVTSSTTPIDYDKQLIFFWFDEDIDVLITQSYGSFAGNISDGTSSVTVESYGDLLTSVNISDGTSSVTTFSYGTLVATGPKTSWIKWPRIGTTDYTINKSNRAGEMPMDWPGDVTNIRKLGSRVIVYGTNGISILTPAGKLFGLNTIHPIGLIGRDAFAGTDFVHYCIDNIGRLYKFDVEFKLLDYREYLSTLTDPVLTLDTEENLLYICDGTTGYIYSPDSKSLGQGPPNVTGIGYQGGIQYAVAPAAIVTPNFEICTDIHDFGTRKFKTVYQLDFGTNLSGQLQAALDFKKKINGDFTTTSWVDVHERGWVKINRKGSEFKFRARLKTYEYFELDRFEIDVIKHAH